MNIITRAMYIELDFSLKVTKFRYFGKLYHEVQHFRRVTTTA